MVATALNERTAIHLMLQMIQDERKNLTDTYTNLLDRIRELDQKTAQSISQPVEVITETKVEYVSEVDETRIQEMQLVIDELTKNVEDLKQMVIQVNVEKESIVNHNNQLQEVNSTLAEELFKANYEIEKLKKEIQGQKDISSTIIKDNDKKVKYMSYDNKKIKDMKYATEVVRQILREANGGLVSSKKIEKEIDKRCGYRWKNFTTAMNTIIGYDSNITKSGRGMYKIVEEVQEEMPLQQVGS